jgi:2-phosphosulfolactate phosphatase
MSQPDRSRWHSQSSFEIKCEWGPQGVAELHDVTDVFIIVDVLSFSTCVDIALGRGAEILPYHWRDASAESYAKAHGARLALKRSNTEPSLSPRSLGSLNRGDRLVLPSPNGAALSMLTGQIPTFAGCLRNRKAVAAAAAQAGRRITVIPAGERWEQDQTLRPAFEDLVGAGAIIELLPGSASPEAAAARSVFTSLREADLLGQALWNCASAVELRERGFENDVEMAQRLDVSSMAPRFDGLAYRPATG